MRFSQLGSGVADAGRALRDSRRQRQLGVPLRGGDHEVAGDGTTGGPRGHDDGGGGRRRRRPDERGVGREGEEEGAQAAAPPQGLRRQTDADGRQADVVVSRVS